jgi:beta-galactosidase/beta-glucuronidase
MTSYVTLFYSPYIIRYELNFMNATMWDSYTWTYSTAFTMAADRLDHIRAAGGSHLLIFDGVKMGANVKLNGKVIGQTTDQFLRYEFPLDGTLLQAGDDANTLTVEFDPSIDCHGRWMACTGGWDWAPYTNTKSSEGIPTFSKGIWRSVYVAEVTAVAIKHVVPQITYLGEYPTTSLSEGTHGGFKVAVKAYLWGAAKSTGTLKVAGSWGQTASIQVTVPAGDSVANVTMNAAADDIKLWWPAGHGAQPLYNVTVSFEPSAAAGSATASAITSASASAAVSSTRRIGFRMFALVTGNDTNPEWVKNNTNGDGSGTLGMYFRVNGAAIFSKGANMIPMEELEGRMSADAHYQIVRNAMEGGMNTLRVWGGGVFLPRAWYDACDELGIMVYHDMMYCDQQGHSPANTPVQDAELRHNIRQLSSHPSIVVWDGGNECRSCGIYTTFVMTVVAQEDASRPVWSVTTPPTPSTSFFVNLT